MIVILVVVFEDMRYHMQHSNWFVMDFEEQHAHGTARLETKLLNILNYASIIAD